MFLVAASPASADRGALSLDLGAGANVLRTSAPYTVSPNTIWGFTPLLNVGLRYAWTNALELTLGGFYELPIRYNHPNVGVLPPESVVPLEGTLTYQLARFGLVAGLRYVAGTIARPFVGLEGGWSHRTFSDLHHINSAGQDNQIAFSDFGTDNIVLQPLVGLEWAFADHASVSIVVRLPILLGPEATVGVSVGLVFSYSWFL